MHFEHTEIIIIIIITVMIRLQLCCNSCITHLWMKLLEQKGDTGLTQTGHGQSANHNAQLAVVATGHFVGFAQLRVGKLRGHKGVQLDGHC